MSVHLTHFLILSTVLFSVGLYGALSKRNAIAILMCIELMLNAVTLVFVAFARYVPPANLSGQIFALFIITVAAAEAAVGIAIVVAIYRSRRHISAEDINLMKW